MLWVVELVNYYWCRGGGGRRSIFCGAFSRFFPSLPLYFPLFISVIGACLLGALGLMAGLSGFASLRCSLHLGVRFQIIVEAVGCPRHPTSTQRRSC